MIEDWLVPLLSILFAVIAWLNVMLFLNWRANRRLTQALKSSEAYARAVVETAVDGVIVIDARGSIRAFNRAAEKIFGYAAHEVLNCNIKILMPSPYREEHDGYVRNYLHTGEKKIIGIGREVVGLRKDGSTFPMELAVSEVAVNDEHGFTGIVRDISARRLAEDEARQRLEQLAHLTRLSSMGEMSTVIAHEINQPLTAIANYAQACRRLLGKQDVSIDAATNVLEKINQQAQRAGEIVRRLRQFMRKHESCEETLELGEFILDSLKLVEMDIRLNNIQLTTELGNASIRVTVDPVQIQQVLINLIRNAVDAMAAIAKNTRRLSIRVVDTDEIVEIAVSDSGEGLSEADEARLLEPFFTTKAAGVGVGLSISESIIKAHEGRLWYQRNPDGGMTFTFSLPKAL